MFFILSGSLFFMQLLQQTSTWIELDIFKDWLFWRTALYNLFTGFPTPLDILWQTLMASIYRNILCKDTSFIITWFLAGIHCLASSFLPLSLLTSDRKKKFLKIKMGCSRQIVLIILAQCQMKKNTQKQLHVILSNLLFNVYIVNYLPSMTKSDLRIFN